MFGASGACRVSALASIDITETPIALLSGMCAWMYCASSAGNISRGVPIAERVTMPHPEVLRVFAAHSSKEAGVPVLVHQRDELIDGGDIGRGLIAVPLHVLTHPEDSPPTHRANIGGFGNRDLDALAGCAAKR